MVKHRYKEDHLAEQIYGRYQRMIRHPDYRTFCKTYEQYFDKEKYSNTIKHFIKHRKLVCLDQENNQYPTFNCPDQNDDLRAYEAFKNIRKQFGTTGVITHYNEPLSKEDMLACPPFEQPLAVDFKSQLHEDGELTFVHEGHYLRADIDIAPKIPTGQILDEIKAFIKYARSEIGTVKKRTHHSKHELRYMIWDLRYEKMPFNKIAWQLGIPRQTAYSIFKKAWSDIIGGEYNTELFKTLFLENCLREERYEDIETKDDSVENRYVRRQNEDEETPEDLDSRNPLNQKIVQDYRSAQVSGDPNELNQYVIKFCGGCQDTNCSRLMIAGIQDGSYNFKKTTPCQDLYTLLTTPHADWPLL